MAKKERNGEMMWVVNGVRDIGEMKKRKQRGGEEHRPWDAWWGSLGSSGLRAVMRILMAEERKENGRCCGL